MDIKGLSPCMQLLPELSESTHTQYFTEKKQKCIFWWWDEQNTNLWYFNVSLWRKHVENNMHEDLFCQLPFSFKVRLKTTHFSFHLPLVTVKECEAHVSLLMSPLKHLLSLSQLPTHPCLPLLPPPFSLPGVYFSSAQTIRDTHTHTPTHCILETSWVSRAQTAPPKILIYFSLSCRYDSLSTGASVCLFWFLAESFKPLPVAQVIDVIARVTKCLKNW